ncbi:hypothetical protein [Aquisphaera insulae]|uniref:hypothetical protein n=1 Tax=Aquisphaera insulae TaxID=2712864 RepID=UPI0013EB1B17|nr:hypothetical protein [Aquisphaera insulae]
MRAFFLLATGLVTAFVMISTTGCGSGSTEVGGVSPEFRKADLASQKAMMEAMKAMQPQKKSKTRAHAGS